MNKEVHFAKSGGEDWSVAFPISRWEVEVVHKCMHHTDITATKGKRFHNPMRAWCLSLFFRPLSRIYTVVHKKWSTFVIINLENLDGINNFNISENGNEYIHSATKLFTYLFHMWRTYDVTVTFTTLMSYDNVCCMPGEAWSSRWRSWLMANAFACLCSCEHFEHTLWLSVCLGSLGEVNMLFIYV